MGTYNIYLETLDNEVIGCASDVLHEAAIAYLQPGSIITGLFGAAFKVVSKDMEVQAKAHHIEYVIRVEQLVR